MWETWDVGGLSKIINLLSIESKQQMKLIKNIFEPALCSQSAFIQVKKMYVKKSG